MEKLSIIIAAYNKAKTVETVLRAVLDFSSDGLRKEVIVVAKLVRRGFYPLEVPINYRSRTFQEGKKIRFLRDVGFGIPSYFAVSLA